MQRAKTLRRKVTPTPNAELAAGSSFGGDTVVKATEDTLDALFAAETEATFKQPWQKLDKGSRLDRLRKFVQSYPDVSPAERASLLTAILQAFELRLLNSKLAVEYDPESATITSVRGLRDRTNSTTGLKTFRIDTAPAATRTTLKRKGLNAAATETPKE
jgi:hypothetical protein